MSVGAIQRANLTTMGRNRGWPPGHCEATERIRLSLRRDLRVQGRQVLRQGPLAGRGPPGPAARRCARAAGLRVLVVSRSILVHLLWTAGAPGNSS